MNRVDYLQGSYPDALSRKHKLISQSFKCVNRKSHMWFKCVNCIHFATKFPIRSFHICLQSGSSKIPLRVPGLWRYRNRDVGYTRDCHGTLFFPPPEVYASPSTSEEPSGHKLSCSARPPISVSATIPWLSRFDSLWRVQQFILCFCRYRHFVGYHYEADCQCPCFCF